MAGAFSWSGGEDTAVMSLSAREYARFHGVVVDILLPRATPEERRELLQVCVTRDGCCYSGRV